MEETIQAIDVLALYDLFMGIALRGAPALIADDTGRRTCLNGIGLAPFFTKKQL